MNRKIARARWADATPEPLEQGRQAFVRACSQGHGCPEVVVPEAEWPGAARRMGPKSNLTAAETENPMRFVQALRSSLTRPAPQAEAQPAPAPAANS
ncbi:MAG: hypothetical protein HY901_11320 [Deltaproteobacteria bacterium]|nr:hypothetical protein [Deltaproteobacteria bacterium]